MPVGSPAQRKPASKRQGIHWDLDSQFEKRMRIKRGNKGSAQDLPTNFMQNQNTTTVTKYKLNEIRSRATADLEYKKLKRYIDNYFIENEFKDKFIDDGKMQPSAWFEDKRSVKENGFATLESTLQPIKESFLKSKSM